MESPAEETPDAPVIDAPPEEPVSEEPVAVEEPIAVEEAVAEEAAVPSRGREPATAPSACPEEPVAEEPRRRGAGRGGAGRRRSLSRRSPIAEEPVAEEPAAEEPVVEEPVAEEPVATRRRGGGRRSEPRSRRRVPELPEEAPALEEEAAGEDDAPAEEAPSTEMPEQIVALSGEDERALAEVLRTAIAEEAERLAASTRYAESAQGFRDLLERWKSAPSAGQMRDRELWRRFAAAREAFYEQRNRAYAERARERSATVERKEALIAESEALATSEDGRAIGDALERLMTEWKAAGHAGRDQEQALWERFSASRRAAFDRRRSMAAERDRARGGARAAKRELIEQAQALVEPFDAAAAEPALATQMEAWRAAGSAGRADDEELWQAFRAARDQVLAQLRAARPPRRREAGAPARRDRGEGSRSAPSAPQQPPQPPVSPLTVALRKHEERVAEVEQRLAEARVGGRARAAEARALERKLADEKGALDRARALLAFAG